MAVGSLTLLSIQTLRKTNAVFGIRTGIWAVSYGTFGICRELSMLNAPTHCAPMYRRNPAAL